MCFNDLVFSRLARLVSAEMRIKKKSLIIEPSSEKLVDGLIGFSLQTMNDEAAYPWG